MTMTFGSPFSGIGMMACGLELAGMTCKWHIEISPYRQKVLKKHWPSTPIHADIKEVCPNDLPLVDGIACGPPCQPVSIAGRQHGDKDPNWLWPELWRIVSHLRPRWMLLENPTALLNRTREFGEILGQMASLGFDAEWDCLSAAHFGAPHRRDRLYIFAHARRKQRRIQPFTQRKKAVQPDHDGKSIFVARPPRLPCWESESEICRVVDGVTKKLEHGTREERRKALGDGCVVPVIKWIGERIVEYEETKASRSS